LEAFVEARERGAKGAVAARLRIPFKRSRRFALVCGCDIRLDSFHHSQLALFAGDQKIFCSNEVAPNVSPVTKVTGASGKCKEQTE
jgi:hypothetical protein